VGPAQAKKWHGVEIGITLARLVAEDRPGRSLSVFWTGNLPKGVPEVDECGLAEISNSKEETRGT
jgi:hypothetical protein